MQGTNAALYITESVKFDLSTDPFYGNFTKGRISNKYYYQVLPYNKFFNMTSVSQSVQL